MSLGTYVGTNMTLIIYNIYFYFQYDKSSHLKNDFE